MAIEEKDFEEVRETNKKLKNAVLKLKEENEGLRKDINELKLKGENKNAKKKSSFDRWFDGDDEGEDTGD